MSDSTREKLFEAIEASWSKDTSNDPNWSPQNPALGQCAVTALVVQDELGGELLRSVVQGVSHYWNLLPDGSEVDLTRRQFDDFRVDDVIHRARDYVVSFPDTLRRYETLKKSVDRRLVAGVRTD